MEQTVTITTYYTEPLTHANAIRVSAQLSLDETREAIRLALLPTPSGLVVEPPIPDLSSIIVALGKIPSKTYSLTNQLCSIWGEHPSWANSIGKHSCDCPYDTSRGTGVSLFYKRTYLHSWMKQQIESRVSCASLMYSYFSKMYARICPKSYLNRIHFYAV